MTRLPTVVFFVTELGRGGAETQLLRVATGLRARAWEVTVVSLMPAVGYEEVLRDAGVAFQSLDLERGRPRPGALVRAARMLAALRPDVVCCFLFHATILGALASAGRFPVVASIRDPSFGAPRRLRLVGLLHRLGLVERTVANSETVAASLRAGGIIPPSRVELIPNGLEVPDRSLSAAERSALRASLGITEDDFLWLHVGNFQAPKDHPNLLDAFSRVATEHPRARLRMVGLGTPPSEVRARLAASPVAERARHIGERSDVIRLMEASDGLVVSSSSEGLPNVIIEAHATRTPVVSTEVGGIPELVEDHATGLLVPPRSPEALARAMIEVMDAPESVLRGWTGRARAEVERRFAIARVLDQWEALFRMVARGAG